MNRAVVGSMLLIIALTFTVYGNSLKGAFLWDDIPIIRDNPDIKSPAGAMDIFTRSVGAAYGMRGSFYRPLYVYTYRINYLFSKLDVRAIHLTNIAVHVLVALTLFWFITILFGDRTLSFLTAIFFVVHPVHTEAVSYMSGRVDPLVTLFILLSLIWYVRLCQQKERIYYLLFSLSCVAAFLCKENALILPVLMLLCGSEQRLLRRPPPSAARLLAMTGGGAAFAIGIAMSLLYVAARLTILGKAPLDINAFDSPLGRLPGFFAAVAGYIRILVAPIDLHMEYGNPRFSLFDPHVLSGLLLTGVLLFFAVRNRNKRPVESFGICWFFIALLPVSNLYPLPFFMAEHYLYLPSIGLFLVLAHRLACFYHGKSRGGLNLPYFSVNNKTWVFIAAIGITGTLGLLTIRQNGYWADQTRFYERTLRFAPDSARICNNLANCYRDAGQNERALALYKRSLKLDPKNAEVYNNLAIMMRSAGKAQEAIALYRKALDIDPHFANAYSNLGIALFETDDIEGAIAAYEKALGINPKRADTLYNLGIAYGIVGRTDESIDTYKKAVFYFPSDPAVLINLSNACRQAGRTQDAIEALKKAIMVDQNCAIAYNNLGLLYYKSQDYALAIKYLDKARELGFVVNRDIMNALDAHR